MNRTVLLTEPRWTVPQPRISGRESPCLDRVVGSSVLWFCRLLGGDGKLGLSRVCHPIPSVLCISELAESSAERLPYNK